MDPKHRAYRRTIARRAVMALALLAALPLPVHAARLAVDEWGLPFFFAVAACVVIVLLLHEVVREDANRDSGPDRVRPKRQPHGDHRMTRRRHGTAQ